MADAPILRVILQRHPMDCSVAVLAMICGCSYEDALVAVAAESPRVLTAGINTRSLLRAAKRLNHRLKRTARYDPDEATGALLVRSNRWRTDHLVVLSEGRVIETDGLLWEPETFFRHYQAEAGVLFVAEPL